MGLWIAGEVGPAPPSLAGHHAINYKPLLRGELEPALASPRNSWSQSSQLQIEIAIQIKIVSPLLLAPAQTAPLLSQAWI